MATPWHTPIREEGSRPQDRACGIWHDHIYYPLENCPVLEFTSSENASSTKAAQVSTATRICKNQATFMTDFRLALGGFKDQEQERTAWVVQRSKRRLQADCLVGGHHQSIEGKGRARRALAGPYGKGYPRTDKSFMRARHARPLYALRVGHPPNSLTTVRGWPARRAGGLRPSSSPLDTPSRTGLGSSDTLVSPWSPLAIRP
jgi:hypothetical protein